MLPNNLEVNLKRNTFNHIDIMQGYTLVVSAKIFDLDNPLSDLSQYAVSIEMKKADNTVIIQSNDFNINQNILTVYCHKSFTAISGKAKLQLVLAKDGMFFGSWIIDVNVIPSAVTDSDIVSNNTATVIEDIRLEVAKALKTKEDLLNTITQSENKIKDCENRINSTIATGNANIEAHKKAINDIIQGGQVVSKSEFEPINESVNSLDIGKNNFFPRKLLKGHNCTLEDVGKVNQETPYYKVTLTTPNKDNNFGYKVENSFPFYCDAQFNFNISFYYRMSEFENAKSSMQSYIRVIYADDTEESLNIISKEQNLNFANGVGLNKWVLVEKTFKAKKLIKAIRTFYFYSDFATKGLMLVTSPVLTTGTKPIKWRETEERFENSLIVKQSIPNAKNLDSYIETGIYQQERDDFASSGQNYPVPRAGILEVVKMIENNAMVFQTYTCYKDYGNRTFTRNRYGGKWGEWNEVVKTNNDLLPKITTGTTNFTGALNNNTVWYSYTKIGNLVYFSWSIVDLNCNNSNTSYANFRLPFSIVDWASFNANAYKINGSTYDHWNIAKVGVSGSVQNSVVHINVQGIDLPNGTLNTVGISGLAVLKLS